MNYTQNEKTAQVKETTLLGGIDIGSDKEIQPHPEMVLYLFSEIQGYLWKL